MSLEMAESRVSDLRKREAAGEAWQWIVDLKEAAKSDSAAAEAELNSIFKLGTPPTNLDGPTDGILVMTTTNPALDAAVRMVTGLWMPWQGKRFDSVSGSGDNRMVSAARLPSKLLWPLYKMKDAADGKLAFDFKTYIDAGKADPDVQVMVIDYSDVGDNPRLIIRSIRDELVEVVPGTYLGKILFRLPRDRYEMIGFFALRT
jgi:hypothetical protein